MATTRGYIGELVGLGLTWIMVGLGLAALVGLPQVIAESGVEDFRLGWWDDVLLGWTTLAVALVVLCPWLILGAVGVRLGWRRLGRAIALGGMVLTGVLWLIDKQVHLRYGEHLVDLARYINEPGAMAMTGSIRPWAITIGLWLAIVACGVLLIGWGAYTAVRWLADHERWRSHVRRLVQRRWRTPMLCLLTSGVVLPLGLWDYWPHPRLSQRAFLAMPVDLRLNHDPYQPKDYDDPAMADLQRRMGRSYKRHFLSLFNPEPIDRSIDLGVDDPPNVVMIVVESLRPDVFDKDQMPRLEAWAQRHARVYPNHRAGTNHSQAGAFALLYGRSPLVFGSVLDAHLPPQWNVALRQAGYRCGYFSGHPVQWRRREEFVNRQTFDVFRHDDEGTWPQWDRKALRGLVDWVGQSSRPVFALSLLMSSHFAYQFPPKFKQYTPVRQDIAWHSTNRDTLSPEERGPIYNRYRNSLLFLDAAITKALKQLDLRKTLVIVVGDHGESFFEDGKLGHVDTFGRQVTRTPLLIAGPGIDPGTDPRMSMHQDVLPTVLHALAGRHVDLAHSDGYDLLDEKPEPKTRLLAFMQRQVGEAVVVDQTGAEPRVRVGMRSAYPTLILRGLEDQAGQAEPRATVAGGQVNRLARSFDQILEHLSQ